MPSRPHGEALPGGSIPAIYSDVVTPEIFIEYLLCYRYFIGSGDQ